MKKIIWILFFVCPSVLLAQPGQDAKFGKITITDFNTKSYAIDTSASAVVISDIGSSKFKENKKGWLSIEFRHFQRIHILNKNGYKYATIEVMLYRDGDTEEKLSDLKAATYNVEGGKVIVEKLDAGSSLFTETVDKDWVRKKFTFPSLKEGSIIEFDYKITSDFMFNLQPWEFQGEIPRLWSEYKVALPQFLNYNLIGQGTQSFYLKDLTEKQEAFTVDLQQQNTYGFATSGPDRANISCLVTEFRWAMKDVPSLKEEAYTTTLNNYISKLEFQLSGYREPFKEESVLNTWPALTKKLLEREDFGQLITKSPPWMKGQVGVIIAGAATETDKAKKIYSYVRDNFVCNNYYQRYAQNDLRKIFDNKTGGIAEINLFLTAMLRAADIKADPVLLSTRERGIIYSRYPIISRFNYLVTLAYIDGKEIFLDAGKRKLGFGKLDYPCYNGDVLIVDESARLVPLKSDQLTEIQTSDVILSSDGTENWKGKYVKQLGYFESMDVRKRIEKEGIDELKKSFVRNNESEIVAENLKFDSLSSNEFPVTANFDFSLTNNQAGIIYINPMMGERIIQNPFKSADRQYPVELPYHISNNYSFTLSIPEGYTVDELPKPLKLNIDGGGGSMEYNIRQTDKFIKLLYKLDISKTVFLPSDYLSLRDFFARIVAKQNEQIVLKKK